MKYGAAIGGVVLVIAGLALLGAGVFSMTDGGATSCGADGCQGDLSVLAFPAGVVAMIVGMMLAGWGLSSIRTERGSTGPWSAFGFMTGLGLLFLAMGWLFLLSVRQAADSPSGGDGAIFLVGALFVVMGLGFVGSDAWRARGIARESRLRASGLAGTATVVGVSDSNWTINNNPMVNLDLDVRMPGQAPFRTRKRTVLSRLSVGSLIPGSVLTVLADPKSPTKVTIDWDAPVTGASGTAFDFGQFAGHGGRMPGGLDSADLMRTVSQALATAADRAATGQPADGNPTVIVNGQVIDLRGASHAGPAAGGSTQGFGGLPFPVVIAGSATGLDASTGHSPAGAPLPVNPEGGRAGSVGPTPPPALGTSLGAGLPASASGSAGGITGRVTLDSIQRTGVELSGNQLYAFDLTVLVPGQPGYQVKHAALIAPGLVPRLVQGASFPAIIDPGQKTQLVVEWDR